jgi:hypothetical protein
MQRELDFAFRQFGVVRVAQDFLHGICYLSFLINGEHG